MSNEFYDPPELLAPGVKARSADINQINQRIAGAFDKLPGELALKGGLVNFAANTGQADNTYLVELPAKVAAYVDGLEVKLRPLRDNTGACTLNVNGIGNMPIKRTDGSNPQASDLQANATIYLVYSSALKAFVLPPVVNSQVVMATAAATAAAESAALSQAWATSLAAVSGGLYGARYYANAAANAATAANSWATSLALVDATNYGAKKYAIDAGAAAQLSQDWATKLGAAVSGGLYSARYWAGQAQAYAEQTAAGQVQADWNEANTASKAFIWNKPSLASYAPKANPAFTGSASATGAITANANADGQVQLASNGIEIGRAGRGAAGNAYVDFHSVANSGDYDVRLEATGGDSGALGKGSLNILAQTVTWNGVALLTGSVFVNPTFTGDASATTVNAQHATGEARFSARSGAGNVTLYYRIADLNAGLHVQDGSGNGATRLRFVGPTGLVAIAESGTGNVVVGRATDDGSGAKLQVAGTAKVTGLKVAGNVDINGALMVASTAGLTLLDSAQPAATGRQWRLMCSGGYLNMLLDTSAATDFSTWATPWSVTPTGILTVPTPGVADNSQRVPTTAYVVARIAQDAMAKNATPAYALQADAATRINGPAYTNGTDGWFRSQGSTGWFNESYGVGIFADMNDGYVKTYNGASFLAKDIQSSGAFYGNGVGLMGTATAFTAGNANTLQGYGPTFYGAANSVALRDGNGFLTSAGYHAGWIGVNLLDRWNYQGISVLNYGMTAAGGTTVLSGYSGIVFGTGAAERGYISGSNLTMYGDITAFSDQTLKTNWRPVTDNFVAKLAGVKSGIFDRIDIKATQAGVGAQSLREVLPEVVIPGKKLSVNYGAGAMVAAVELAKVAVDHDARIEQQAQQILDLANLVDSLTQQLKGIQSK